MEHAKEAAVRRTLQSSWRLADLVHVHRLQPGGATSDVFEVRCADGRRFAAKLTYDLRTVVEPGLVSAELVQQRSGVKTGRPVRAIDGSLTVATDSVAGLQHPLALLEWVDGVSVQVGQRPEDCGRLLALVHETLAGLDVSAPDNLVGYLEDRTVDYPGRDLIDGVLREAVDATIGHDALTWGTCYGDGPELWGSRDGLGLIDWGAVTRAPLLWDVHQWAVAAGAQSRRFVDAYVGAGGPAGREVMHRPVMQQLAAAHELRFRTFRMANSDHFDESVTEDRDAVVRAATILGVDPAAILDAVG